MVTPLVYALQHERWKLNANRQSRRKVLSCLKPYKMKGVSCFIIAYLAVFTGVSHSSEIDEFEVLNSENNPVRREFDNHTLTCFKLFKSSMLKLTVLFLDPESETATSQQESKCWVKCMLEQFQFMKVTKDNLNTETGEILPSKIIEKASDLSPTTKAKLSDIVEKCENYAGSITELCSKGFGFARCVFEMYRGRESMVPVIPVVPVNPTPVVVTG